MTSEEIKTDRLTSIIHAVSHVTMHGIIRSTDIAK